MAGYYALDSLNEQYTNVNCVLWNTFFEKNMTFELLYLSTKW